MIAIAIVIAVCAVVAALAYRRHATRDDAVAALERLRVARPLSM